MLQIAGKDGDVLLNFLISRAQSNFEIANYLHWYIHCQQLIEAADKDTRAKPYERAQRKLMSALERSESGRETIGMIERQHEMVLFLTKLAQEVKGSREARTRKIDRLKSTLAAVQKNTSWGMFSSSASVSQRGVRLNLNPGITTTGFYAEDAEIFKSSMMPLGLSFLSQVPQPDVNAADRIQYK